ncbi:MAG: hypothetical protein J5727_10930 [Kiritimatiellae bacterium]|nr:hypothetical protein [Kiritimatiellia bacterium]
MSRSIKTSEILAATAFLAAVGVAVWIVCHSSSQEPSDGTQITTDQKTHKRVQAGKRSRVAKSAVRIQEKRDISKIDVDDDDAVDENGVKLTREMRLILAELQDCMDREDRKSLSKLCEKIAKIQRERGYDAVPVSIRAKAVEALGLFLPATLADLVGFLADSDPEVVDSAFEQLDTLLNDTTIGDRELAGMLVAMSKVLTNEDAVDSLAMAVDMNMRNSVKVSTCKQIIDSGNDVVVARIKETIADMLEVDVNRLPSSKEVLKARLTEWLENNPDGEDDEDFYSGVE